MPLYDFECPHGHRFETIVPIAHRNDTVPCEGTVNRLLTDDELEEFKGELEALKDRLSGDPAITPIVDAPFEFVPIEPGKDNGVAVAKVAVKKVPCQLRASLVVGAHNNPAGMLDHGSASNRDAAREGRYDPLNPSRRFMAKGRSWRK